MTKFRGEHKAFGHPGIEPRWTHGDKQGIGTAYSVSSCAWFTIWNGFLTEIYYPTIDKPQTRDLQYLVSDGESFLHEEKRQLQTKIEELCPQALGYHITNSDPQGRYALHKEVIGDPHLPCILQHTWLTGESEFLERLQLYTLCAPHLDVGGKSNNGYVIQVAGREILVAEKNDTWLALGATVPFKRLSVGYVGYSDGWQDLADNFKMDWEFDRAESGNIALTGELDLSQGYESTLAVAFGNTLQRATTTLFQSLDISFEQQKSRFNQQWSRTHGKVLPLEKVAQDKGNLYYNSFSILLAHEDKQYPGAMIASLSIPWGEMKRDDSEYGGYHFVWPRDLVSSATGLLAAGETATPLRILVYLATSQHADGGFAQNFWIDGRADRRSSQLDEVSFPILLAWHLYKTSTLRNFDPYPMVVSAAGYLIRHGPVTAQERWEQSSGYSPATLAVGITALICAASWMRDRGNPETAIFVEEYADFLECHIEAWTVTTESTLVPEISQHYIRITPASPEDTHPNENPNQGMLKIPHRHPNSQQEFLAKEIVDASFLELVRYGVRSANDPLIVDSLKVVDAILKTDTPFGSVWRRYNHDGHGQRADGSAWNGWGIGRSWTLLTGERGHYELAARRDATEYIKAMEEFASCTGLLPEQVWDTDDLPDAHMYLGRPTGSAMPLLWAHAEYIKLLRSVKDGRVFDLIPEVAERYLGDRSKCKSLSVWKFNRQVQKVRKENILRIIATAHFKLHWTWNDWQTIEETSSSSTNLAIYFVDIPIQKLETLLVEFTFFWSDCNSWEGLNYQVTMGSD